MNPLPRLRSPDPVTDDLRAIAAAGEDLLRHTTERAGEGFEALGVAHRAVAAHANVGWL